MFQQILVKDSSVDWVNISPTHISFINCSIVITSRLVIVLFLTLKAWQMVNKKCYVSKKKPSTCNCSGNLSSPLNGSYQHRNLVYYCRFCTPYIKENHICITLVSQNIHLRIDSSNITILPCTSQREIQHNFLISYGVKRKSTLM